MKTVNTTTAPVQDQKLVKATKDRAAAAKSVKERKAAEKAALIGALEAGSKAMAEMDAKVEAPKKGKRTITKADAKKIEVIETPQAEEKAKSLIEGLQAATEQAEQKYNEEQGITEVQPVTLADKIAQAQAELEEAERKAVQLEERKRVNQERQDAVRALYGKIAGKVRSIRNLVKSAEMEGVATIKIESKEEVFERALKYVRNSKDLKEETFTEVEGGWRVELTGFSLNIIIA